MTPIDPRPPISPAVALLLAAAIVTLSVLALMADAMMLALAASA